MSASDRLFKLELPADEQPTGSDVVVQFPAIADDALPVEAARPQPRPQLLDRLTPAKDRLADGWRAAWVGDGALGMRPRPIADLARQFWTEPKPYIRDALILRIPYALYGVPVIAVTALAHLALLVISYPSLLAGSALLVVVISLFM